MAGKLNLMEAMEKYKSTGNNEFFTLADDGDTAIVRFLYSSVDELDWFVVHEAEIGGKKRWVQCTEEADCPMCAGKGKPQLKLFIQLVQKGREDVVMTWERGQKFIPNMVELFNEYGDLTQHLFEIERKGKKGDQRTTYKMVHITKSEIGEDDLPEKQVFLGEEGFVLQKSHSDMQKILNGSYNYTKVDTPARPGRTAPSRTAGAGTRKTETEVF